LLSPKKRRAELLSRSKKFRDIADGLAEGNIIISPTPIKPPIPGEKEKPGETAVTSMAVKCRENIRHIFQ